MSKTGKIISRTGRNYLLEDLRGRKFLGESDTIWQTGKWVNVTSGIIVSLAGDVTAAVVYEV